MPPRTSLHPDQKRAYYAGNMLFLDSDKAGFSRNALVKALEAEGVQASIWDYPEQHMLKILFGVEVVAPSTDDYIVNTR